MSGRLAAGAFAVVLGVAAAWLLLEGSRPAAPITAGRPAPSFDLPALDGDRRVSLESLRGRVVLLNFWATWCKPCEDEMPAMERLYRRLADEGFELLAVSVDDDPEQVVEFRDRLQLTFPILLDPDKRAAGAYQSYRFPESYLIDPEGVLLARYIGPRDWDAPEYEQRIRRILAGSEVAAAASRGRYADRARSGEGGP